MIKLLFTTILTTVTSMRMQTDPALDQIVMFKEKNPNPIGILTTSAGAPVSLSDASNTLNKRLIVNEFFMDSITHFARERLPERVVHSNAVGAHGYFEVTHNITSICKAKLFSHVGKKTKVLARLSPGIEIRGGNDLDRNVRGFAIKFYTEDGNFDTVGINTPMYFYKDPRLFSAFVHAARRNPATNLNDPNTLWDYLTLQLESLYTFLVIFSDPGIPDGYRHMPGHVIHTYQVENNDGVLYFVRFHFLPDAGSKYLQSDEARNIQAVDPDYFTRELYRAIGNGDYPSWTLSIQVLTLDEVKKAGSYVFDVTRILPIDKYPLRPVGKLVLNRNVMNHFLETEQLAFSPANLVPGILGSPDTLFESRRLAYREAQYYRLGVNFNKISVNCPFQTKVLTYNRDGRPSVGANEKNIPNYYPNSFNGPVATYDNSSNLIEIIEGEPNNFQQATDYVNQLSADQMNRLVENILYSLRPVVKFIQNRAVKHFALIHPSLGNRIAQGLLVNRTMSIEKNYN